MMMKMIQNHQQQDNNNEIEDFDIENTNKHFGLRDRKKVNYAD